MQEAKRKVNRILAEKMIQKLELPETDRFDTDLFSGHSGKGHYGTKPAY